MSTEVDAPAPGDDSLLLLALDQASARAVRDSDFSSQRDGENKEAGHDEAFASLAIALIEF